MLINGRDAGTYCKSIYIRSRRACDKFASTLSLLAVWRRGGGPRYTYIPVLKSLINLAIWVLALVLNSIPSYLVSN